MAYPSKNQNNPKGRWHRQRQHRGLYKVALDVFTSADPARLGQLAEEAAKAGGEVRLCLYEPAWESGRGYFTFWAAFTDRRSARRIRAELCNPLWNKKKQCPPQRGVLAMAQMGTKKEQKVSGIRRERPCPCASPSF